MLPLHVLVPADIRNCVMDMAAAENVSTAEVVRDLLSTAITARGTNGKIDGYCLLAASSKTTVGD